MTIKEAHTKFSDQFLKSDSNINGIGIGADEHGEFISVYVTEIKEDYPKEVEGYRIKIEQTGPFKLQ